MLNQKQRQSYRAHGGLKTTALPFTDIEVAPVPHAVHIPTDQKAEVIVSVGDTVHTGQPLTQTDDCVASHASVSGKVTSITETAVSIRSDNLDTTYKRLREQPKDINNYPDYFRSMGLVGLGGAAFPVDRKLNSLKPSTLLVNAAECDPAIYCDEALMQERTAEIFEGIQIAIEATGAKHCIIGIEDNKTTAIDKMQQHLPDHIQMICVPAIYPSGAEETLLRLCTGKSGSLKDNQTICFNVATCYTMYQAVSLSRPLISRIVTVVEDNQVRNLEVRIGTPLKALLESFDTEQPQRLICGGRMMGWSVTENHCVEKHTNSLLVIKEPQPSVTPCIRCGACEDVCPESLLPQHLYWHSTKPDTSKLQELRLEQCIECGCCDVVCPSHIPLAGLFRDSKQVIQQEKSERHKAALAKLRYEKHLLRNKEKTVRQRKKLDSKTNELMANNASEDAKKALIAKALQRKKNKNLSAPDNSPDPKAAR